MKEIQLTQGQVALIDDEDFDKVSQYKWFARYDKSTGMFVTIGNGPTTEGKRRTIYMHEVILGTPNGYTADHVDRNPLNNRRSNLRLANPNQQSLNKSTYNNSEIPYKGVSYKTANSKYVAQMQVLGSKKHIGLFDSPTDAALTYDQAVLKYWSQVPDDPISGNYIQFLYLNFPEG